MVSEEDDEFLLRESPGKPTVLPLGRILSVLLGAEARVLERAVSKDQTQGLIGKSLAALLQHAVSSIANGTSLQPICVPILEHAAKSKDQSVRKNSIIVMHFLLQNKVVGGMVANNLSDILKSKLVDNRVKLGWCVVIKELVQRWSGAACENNPLYTHPLEIMVSCTPQLVQIVCDLSVKEGKKKFPTRLTIAAADCILVITKTLAGGPVEEPEPEKSSVQDHLKGPLITLVESSEDDAGNSHRITDDHEQCGNDASTSGGSLFTNVTKRELTLWSHLDSLKVLVHELHEWNDRSRPLFAKGLQQVEKRLQMLADFRDSLGDQGGEGSDVSVGAAVLVACWLHYGRLMLTEDKSLSTRPQPVLKQWLNALQYCVQQEELPDAEEGINWDDHQRKAEEMRRYALACVALTLGRLDARHLEAALEDIEPELLKVLLLQVRSGKKSIVDLGIAILRTVLFRNSPKDSAASASLERLESVVPLLMDMLDARDMAARAVVLLVAEFFSLCPDSPEMEKLFCRLDSADPIQRRNALDILTELLAISTRSDEIANANLRQLRSICLGDWAMRNLQIGLRHLLFLLSLMSHLHFHLLCNWFTRLMAAFDLLLVLPFYLS